METNTAFKQKKVNHIFHYTPRFDTMRKILRNGFAPSYCKENINKSEFFIPLVSFCNIPIKDVEKYLFYGKYGIGMSLEWAVENGLSPVIYIHKNTPFKEITDFLNNYIFKQYINQTSDESHTNNNHLNSNDISKMHDFSTQINQFFKNWKTKYKGNKIITYHEREWRYIPDLPIRERIIHKGKSEFKLYEDGKIKKPHLPNSILPISKITDIRYIVIKTENQRQDIRKLLENKFSKESVQDSLISGKLLILTVDQLHDDF